MSNCPKKIEKNRKKLYEVIRSQRSWYSTYLERRQPWQPTAFTTLLGRSTT